MGYGLGPMRKTLLLLALLLAPSVMAESLNKPLRDCTEVLQQVVKSRLEMLTPDEAAHISSIYDSQASGETPSIQKVFEFFFKVRLRGLSEAETEVVQKINQAIKTITAKSFLATYSYSKKSIRLPKWSSSCH